MEKINSLSKIRIFLEYLDKNFHKPYKRTKEALEKDFQTNIGFSDIYTYCISNRLIKSEITGKKGGFTLGVSIGGLEFLERQKQNDRDKQIHKFQGTIVYATVIIALSVVSNMLTSFEDDLMIVFRTILFLLVIGFTATMVWELVFSQKDQR